MGKIPCFIDSSGAVGLLGAILENDLKIFNKVVRGMKNICKKDNKITLLKWMFSRKNYSKLKKNELDQLSVQALYFFKFLDDFGKCKNVQDKICVFTVDDSLQSMNSSYCRPFQLYFYHNLFELFENSIVTHKKSSRLDHKLVQELLNEIFTRNPTLSKNILDGFILKNNHKLSGEHSSMSEDET